jgi:hypothetical protein
VTDFTTTYIVGGGPSLRQFPWHWLRDKTVLAINRAYEVCPQAALCYFQDKKFFDWHGQRLLDSGIPLATGAREELGTTIHGQRFEGQRYVLTQLRGLTMQPGQLAYGNCSGYAAINLACQLGARQIYLLGYDMERHGDRYHWHDGYPIQNLPTQFASMNYFHSLVEPLHNLDVAVTLVGPSTLTCFPRIEFSELFARESDLCDA